MRCRLAPDDVFEPRGRPPFAAHKAAFIPCGFPLSEEVHPWCAATGLCNGLRAYHWPVSSGGAIRVSLRWNDEPDLHVSVDLLFDSPTIFVYGLLEASAARDGRFIGGISALLRSWFGVDVNVYTLVQPNAAAPVPVPVPVPLGKSRQRIRCPPPPPPPSPPLDVHLVANGSRIQIHPFKTEVNLDPDLAIRLVTSWLPQYCRSLLNRRGPLPPTPMPSCIRMPVPLPPPQSLQAGGGSARG